MTKSYDSVSSQSYGNNFHCGHLSPSRGGQAINGLMQPRCLTAPSTARCWEGDLVAPKGRTRAFTAQDARFSLLVLPPVSSQGIMHKDLPSRLHTANTQETWNMLFLELSWNKSTLTTTHLFKGLCINKYHSAYLSFNPTTTELPW